MNAYFSSRLVNKLEENKSDEVELFKSNVNKVMKDILGRFKDLQFFTGKWNYNMIVDVAVALSKV